MENAVALNGKQWDLMGKMMNLAQQRQQVIAHNLSNVNTPGYIRQDIDFHGQIQEILRNGSLQKSGAVKATVFEDTSNSPRLDGNNVQSPSEMNQMMQNGLLYELLNRAFSSRTSILRMAMTGARS